MRIIVVDDTEEDRYLLKLLLESQQHEVILAENGQLALEAAHTHPPDVVISDILMPVMDGYALLWQMRQDAALRKVPVVFYTGTFTEEDDQELALKLGASRFLLKPLALDRIVEEVETVYREHQEGQGAEQHQSGISELEYYRTYSQRLLSKLGDKLTQMEQANALLRERSEEIRRRAEENNRLLEEARTALKVRDRFLAVAAHEIRTPLTILKGWLQLAERGISGSLRIGGKPFDPEKGQEQLHKGLAYAEKLERLMEDMADTTEAVEGRLILDLQPLNLRELVEQVVSEERFLVEQPQLSLELFEGRSGSEASGERWQMLGDSARLGRALANLLDNALKFSPEKKTVRIKLELDTTHQQALISISDEGIGIAKESQARLFQPYYQGEDDWQNRRFGGLGLGLFVTRAIIEGHGGQIELVEDSNHSESKAGNAPQEKGNGTTFRLTLPLVSMSL
jgi:signal transduction histidine kinase